MYKFHHIEQVIKVLKIIPITLHNLQIQNIIYVYKNY